jgi:hypothetical protein
MVVVQPTAVAAESAFPHDNSNSAIWRSAPSSPSGAEMFESHSARARPKAYRQTARLRWASARFSVSSASLASTAPSCSASCSPRAANSHDALWRKYSSRKVRNSVADANRSDLVGLDVAMNNPTLMGILSCSTDFDQNLKLVECWASRFAQHSPSIRFITMNGPSSSSPSE